MSLEVELKLAAEPDDLALLTRHADRNGAGCGVDVAKAGVDLLRHAGLRAVARRVDPARSRAGRAVHPDAENRRRRRREPAGARRMGGCRRRQPPGPAGCRRAVARLPHGIAEALRPLFVTEIDRVAIEIEPKAGTRIEAAVDHGAIRTAADAAAASRSARSSSSSRSGDPAALYDLALELLETAPLRIDLRSKSERGYRLAAGDGSPPAAVSAEPVVLDPHMTIEDALQRVGRACLAPSVAQRAGGPRAATIEGVHQMRVATAPAALDALGGQKHASRGRAALGLGRDQGGRRHARPGAQSRRLCDRAGAAARARRRPTSRAGTS